MDTPTPPRSIEVTHDGSALVIQRRWLAADVVIPIAFGVLWIGFLTVWLGAAGVLAPIFVLFAAGHVLFAVLLVYAIACRLLNRTTVRVGGGRIVVTHGPLPLWGRFGPRAFATERIAQLYARHASDGRGWWWALSHEVVARVGHDVVDIVDVRTFAEASFIERAIERHLEIVDDGLQRAAAPVPRPRSIQVLGGEEAEQTTLGYRDAERPADGAGTLVIRVNWPREGVAFDAGTSVVLGALLVYAWATGQAQGQLLGIGMLAVVALGVGYRAVANLLGHTTVSLDGTRLSITHGPLPIPFRRGREVSTRSIRDFRPMPKPSQRRNERWVSAGVQCDDTTFEVTPTRENDEADYVVRKLQEHLSRLRGEPAQGHGPT